MLTGTDHVVHLGQTVTMRVAIIGAGVAGPALAMLLKHNLGWQPAVFEAAHAIKEVCNGVFCSYQMIRCLAHDCLALGTSTAVSAWKQVILY